MIIETEDRHILTDIKIISDGIPSRRERAPESLIFGSTLERRNSLIIGKDHDGSVIIASNLIICIVIVG